MPPQPSGNAALDLLCRHLVSISIVARRADGTEDAEATSCFVMEVSDTWFLVTAGHVVDYLDDVYSKSEVLDCVLFDGWAPGAKDVPPIPFNAKDAHKFSIDKDEIGIDVGVFVLPDLVRRGLLANGVVPFGPHTWQAVPDKMDFHYVVGLPLQFNDPVRVNERVVALHVSPSLIEVKPCAPPADVIKPTARFFGRLAPQLTDHTGEVLKTVKGLSGAPIVGFKKTDDGKAAYFLVAIQAGWLPTSRIVYGNFAMPLGWALAAEMSSTTGKPTS